MAWLTIHHYSMVLGLQTTTEVLLPEPDQGIGVTGAVWDGISDLPVLYLLHGSSDDSTIWMRRTSVERYNAGRRLAIVIPSCGKSMYVNQKYGYDYYTYLTEELPQIVSRFCRISTRREDSYISGLSMGGYGCLLAGLKNPEKYSKVACQSGMVDADSFIAFQEFKRFSEDPEYAAQMKQNDAMMYGMMKDMVLCYGSYGEWKDSDYDLVALLKRRIAQGEDLPELMLTIGKEDMLYPTYPPFMKVLDDHGIPYQYIEEPGIHEWAVWDRHIQYVLNWVCPKEEMRQENEISARLHKEGQS